MFFDEIAAAPLPSISIQNSGSSRDFYDLFLDPTAIDDFGFTAHQSSFASSTESCFDTNSNPSNEDFQPLMAAPESQAHTCSVLVAGVYSGDAAFKNRIDFKADMPWQERARVKQILTGQASELSHQQQIGFLQAYGINEQHELWAMYMENLSPANN